MLLQFKNHDVFLIPSGNSYLLYAPTLRKLLRIRGSLVEKLTPQSFAEKSIDSSLANIYQIFEKSLQNSIKPFQQYKAKSRYFHLALGLTKGCTLACAYCHAEADNAKNAKTMNKDLLDSALLHAFESAKKDNLKGVNVSFAVGGEPTSKWPFFKYCIETINDLKISFGIPTNISLTTNGYYGQNRNEFLVNSIDNILLSLDGPPEIQNIHRPTISGAASFTKVMASAQYFAKHAKSFSIRATVSSLSVMKMTEILEYFKKNIPNLSDILFEPLVPIGRALIFQSGVTSPEENAFIDHFLKAKMKGELLNIRVKTSAAQQSRLVTTFCGAMTIPSFTVTTDGIVTTCERDSDGTAYGYGRYDKKGNCFVLDPLALKNNLELTSLPMECNECFCKWHCAGDCPDLRTIGYNRCNITKKLIQNELENFV